MRIKKWLVISFFYVFVVFIWHNPSKNKVLPSKNFWSSVSDTEWGKSLSTSRYVVLSRIHLWVHVSKELKSCSAPQFFLFDTFKVGPRTSSGSPKVFVSVPRSWRSDCYKIFGPKTAILKQTLRCCYSKSEHSTVLTLGVPSSFSLNLIFEEKFFL